MITTQPASVNYLNRISCDIQERLEGQDVQEVFALWGETNAYSYWYAKNAGMLYRDKQTGSLTINQAQVSAVLEPGGVVECTIGWLSSYLQKYWPKAYHSEKSVAKYRRKLAEEFKLFSLEERDWSNPTDRHRQTNPCSNFNPLRAAIFGRCCEEILAFQGYELEGVSFEEYTQAYSGNWSDRMDGLREDFLNFKEEEKALPEHKGYTLVLLYDAFFQGIDKYNRKCAPSGTPRPETLIALEREWCALEAEDRIEAFKLEDPSREVDEIIATEKIEILVPEVVEACTDSVRDNVSAVFERALGWFALADVVRPPSKVPPLRQPPLEQSLTIPTWVRQQSDRAWNWWEKKLDTYGRWLLDLAPDWVQDTYVFF